MYRFFSHSCATTNRVIFSKFNILCIAKSYKHSEFVISLLDIAILPAPVCAIFLKPLAISKDGQTLIRNARERIVDVFLLCKYVRIIESKYILYKIFMSRMQFKSKDYLTIVIQMSQSYR